MSVRIAVSAYFVLLPLEPDLQALSFFGVGIHSRPMVGIPTREAQSRQRGPTDAHGLELFFWLDAEALLTLAMADQDVFGLIFEFF